MALTFYTVQLNKKGFPIKYICPAADSSELTHELPQTFAPRSFSDPGEACNEFEASIGTAPRCYLEQSNFNKKAKALRRMKRVIERNEQPELRKLETPQPCSFYVFNHLPCPDTAMWEIILPERCPCPICKSHMQGMAAMNSDNADFLANALEGLSDV